MYACQLGMDKRIRGNFIVVACLKEATKGVPGQNEKRVLH